MLVADVLGLGLCDLSTLLPVIFKNLIQGIISWGVCPQSILCVVVEGMVLFVEGAGLSPVCVFNALFSISWLYVCGSVPILKPLAACEQSVMVTVTT